MADVGRAPESSTARAFIAAAKRLILSRKAEAACACLLLVMAANLLSVIPRKGLTNDEIVHIPAGYYHLVEGFFQLNNEHPPLVKMWAALPLLFVQPDEPPAPPRSVTENFSERTWGYHGRFWPGNKARFESIAFWARVMMIPWALALGLVVFLFARELFGARAALFALALYTLEPNFLAHGRYVHTDVPAAFVYLLFFFTLYKYFQQDDASNLRRSLWLSAACALALVTKFSMVVLVPVAFGALLLAPLFFRARFGGQSRARTFLHAAAGALVVLVVVNAVYYFQSPPIDPSDVAWAKSKAAPVFDELMTAFRVLSKVAPTYFMFGFFNVVLHSRDGHAASLLRMHADAGWWFYFPVAFALKTTLPFLLLSVASLGWALWELLVRRRKILLFLLAPLALYTIFSLTSNINIGIRHFLPAFPFLLITGGALLNRLLDATARTRFRFAGLALVVVTLGWVGFEAARAYPNYLVHMNQLAAGRPGWQSLSDSNVEWGEDVPELAAYLRARGETQVRGAMSAAWGTLKLYDIEYHDMVATPDEKLPATRYVAIGAGFLNGSTVPGGEWRGHGDQRTNLFARYRDRQPEAVFGNSIYLYREEP